MAGETEDRIGVAGNIGDPEDTPPWPTIVLPEERRAQLEAKLLEYKGRLDQQQHPDLQLMLGSDSMGKIVVLERLLRDGSVDTRALMGELRDRFGDMYNPLHLVGPISVINDYCLTGGVNTYSGETGEPRPLVPPAPLVE